jgi:hypothetical protein
MAEQLGLSRDDTDRLRWAGLLHDIGKIHVPGEILNKPGVPDEAEWEAIRGHPEEGDRLIEPVRAWLGPWGKAVVEHHERWDGKGYPRGISGMQISLAGRVIAVTDSYEVMTATRSYKKPMSAKAAREELTRSAGSHFDPAMVRAFLSVPIGRVSWSAGPVAWLAQLPFLAQIPTWGATAVVATGVMVATPTAAGTTPPWPASTPAPVQVDAPPPSQGDSSQSSITIAPAVAGPTDTSSQDAQVASDSSGGPPTPPPGQQKRSTTTTTTAPESTTITTTTRPTTTTDSSTTTVPGKGNGPGGKGKGKNSSSSSG